MYLDPGFGGMLLQVIVAMVAVGGAIIYSIRKKISNFFSGNKDKAKTNEVNNNTPIDVVSSTESEDDAIDMIDD